MGYDSLRFLWKCCCIRLCRVIFYSSFLPCSCHISICTNPASQLNGHITAWISPYPSHVPLNVSLAAVISGWLKEYFSCSTISSISPLCLLWSMLWKSLINTSLSYEFFAPCCFFCVCLMNPFGVTDATAAEQLSPTVIDASVWIGTHVLHGTVISSVFSFFSAETFGFVLHCYWY